MSLNSAYASSLEFPIPNTWEDRSVYTYVANTGDDFRTNLVVARERKQKDAALPAFAEQALAGLKKQFPDLKVDETANITLHGKPALSRTFHFNARANMQVMQQQVIVMSEQWVYTLTFSTTPAQYSQDRKVFADMLANTRLN